MGVFCRCGARKIRFWYFGLLGGIKSPGHQGGEVREWTEVLPDGRVVTYTAEVEDEIIQEQEDIEITGCRVLTTSSKENSHMVETVVRLAEGEIIKVTKTNSRLQTDTNVQFLKIQKTDN